jgi:hypothetical protein
MHSLRLVAISVAVSLWACGEEDASVLVGDETAWQLACPSGGAGCTSFHSHTALEEDGELEVKCDKSGSRLNIRLKDPGSESDNRPGSTLRIEGLDPEAGSCTVTVTEAPDLEANEAVFTGTCREGDCEISGGEGEGWDFKGSIKCNHLVDPNNTSIPPRTLVKPGSGGDGAPLSIDNCG